MRFLFGIVALALLSARAAAQDAPAPMPAAPADATARATEPARAIAGTRAGAIVTAEDVALAINARPAPMRGRFVDPAAVEGAARSLLRERLLADEARRTGLDHEPGMRRDIDRVLMEGMLVRAVAQAPSPPITDAQVEAYYRAHLADMFTEPEKIRALVILVREEAVARRLIGQLRRANERRFRAVARRSSQGRSSNQGGDVGWLWAGGPQDVALIAEAFRLHDVGRMSERPVQGAENVFYIVRVAEVRAPEPMQLESLRRTIRSRIEAERRIATENALLDRLMRERGVRVVPAAPYVRVTPVPANSR
ncbi:MAG: peptidyl-prolyl cis-trans isomerase [Sandaracinaceae bacterium]|nr:peptidyl-prolyl cis-trans isomerase [Sandaracinaceae bacterium]